MKMVEMRQKTLELAQRELDTYTYDSFLSKERHKFEKICRCPEVVESEDIRQLQWEAWIMSTHESGRKIVSLEQDLTIFKNKNLMLLREIESLRTNLSYFRDALINEINENEKLVDEDVRKKSMFIINTCEEESSPINWTEFMKEDYEY